MMGRKMMIQFIKTESSAAIVLFAATILALIVDNSPWSVWYQNFFHSPVNIHWGSFSMDQSFLFWINDGLMTLFFLLLSLEIKRELFQGELASPSKAMLPGLCALGGVVLPACIYVAVNAHHPHLWRGWAIPTATDVAFSLGILALLGKCVPASLKVFLTALAIFDDVCAIIIIALFYTAHISTVFLLLAGVLSVVLWIVNRCKVTQKWPYMLIGFLMWALVLKSGVHATLVGIVVGLAIPLRGELPEIGETSPLRSLEKSIHPWVAFGILPLFAFANVGINFSQLSYALFFTSLPLGILCGLVFGKSLGIVFSSWVGVKMRWVSLPNHCRFSHIFGVSLLAGVGFTMSLFIGGLAFSSDQLVLVRLGVLGGSLVSGLCGYLWLKRLASR
jgi:NhaA family Na+:H+ antiporter